jgi:hypothetical protein
VPHTARQPQHVRPGPVHGKKADLKVMPITSAGLSDEHDPGERAPGPASWPATRSLRGTAGVARRAR